MKPQSGFGRWLGLCVVLAALVIAGGCERDRVEEKASADEIEFGIWVPGQYGELRFVATSEVPNVDDQAFGWRARAAIGEEPVKWVETVTLPAAPESWEGVEENPNVAVSEDGRTATSIGVAVPDGGYVENAWYVAIGDPQGEYEMSVELSDGRKARFRFTVGEASEGAI